MWCAGGPEHRLAPDRRETADDSHGPGGTREVDVPRVLRAQPTLTTIRRRRWRGWGSRWKGEWAIRWTWNVPFTQDNSTVAMSAYHDPHGLR